MLKKLWQRVVSKKSNAHDAHKQIFPYETHHLSEDNISYAAEKVIHGLQQAGFEAYIVGGAVRDLLLGVEPKDFDIATNAKPQEIRAIFRRSRIIGRRFQIVHVMVGQETIEVTTFRGGDKGIQNQHGRIMKDNTYGTLAEDAQRRDFTCNALYFNPKTCEIIDYHNGVADIRQRQLVIIGNAAERYQEDPVRIMRAIRLSAKLGFDIEDNTAEPIARYAQRLKDEPVARLFEEILKILFSGYSRRSMDIWRKLGIRSAIHPVLDALQNAAHDTQANMITTTLKNTDERLREDKSVSVGFVLAAIMWGQLEAFWQQHLSQNKSPANALGDAINEMRDTMEKGWGIPQKFSTTMREIWQLQPQFEHRRGARPYRLLGHPRFRAAYDFLVLRAKLKQVDSELAQWWADFQHASDSERNEMTTNAPVVPTNQARKRKRKPRRKKVLQKNID